MKRPSATLEDVLNHLAGKMTTVELRVLLAGLVAGLPEDIREDVALGAIVATQQPLFQSLKALEGAEEDRCH